MLCCDKPIALGAQCFIVVDVKGGDDRIRRTRYDALVEAEAAELRAFDGKDVNGDDFKEIIVALETELLLKDVST